MDPKKIAEMFNSEGTQKRLAAFAQKMNNERVVKNRQLQRLRDSGRFVELTERAIRKYATEEYKDRWYKRGIEPREDLLYFLYSYAERYGESCDAHEWEKYGNDFSSHLFVCEGYYFNRMDGQGTVIHVTKSENK